MKYSNLDKRIFKIIYWIVVKEPNKLNRYQKV